MTIFKKLIMAVFLTSTMFAVAGCDDNNAVEEAAEEVTDEIDDATSQ